MSRAEVTYRPHIICRAIVPCDSAEPLFRGQACGFPVESGPAFKYLLNYGEWVSP